MGRLFTVPILVGAEMPMQPGRCAPVASASDVLSFPLLRVQVGDVPTAQHDEEPTDDDQQRCPIRMVEMLLPVATRGVAEPGLLACTDGAGARWK